MIHLILSVYLNDVLLKYDEKNQIFIFVILNFYINKYWRIKKMMKNATISY